MASPASTSPSRSQRNSPPPPMDLRHMQSNTVLVSPKDTRRVSQVIGSGGGGAKSPIASIPSSPTSVHSSSSAIFERDIEPLNSPSPPSTALHPPNPHRIPRAKTTEQLEQSVPSVLDSAAEILASLPNDVDFGDLVAVEAPAVFEPTTTRSGIGSRSSSPGRKSLLLSIPQQQQQQQKAVTIVTPLEDEQHSVPSGSPKQSHSPPISPPMTLSHPPSPTQVPINLKRLSFMSYNDLLASTPASTLPLSFLTSTAEPPPHIPSVCGINNSGVNSAGSAAGSTTASLRGFPLDITGGKNNRDSIVLLDEVGGEWERAGLGKGLEERLEALMPSR